MESVTTQDVSVNDLRWKIEYRPEQCTLCGSCVASCTLNAIEVATRRLDLTVSRAAQPEPIREHLARPVIRQKVGLANACVGCGMCEKVCPNQAIRPVRNPDSRYALLARRDGPIKRGGRTNLNAQRTLDRIIVGRISQMTDPALDSERHTFDIRAPFGRVLLPDQLPLRVEGGEPKRPRRCTGFIRSSSATCPSARCPPARGRPLRWQRPI